MIRKRARPAENAETSGESNQEPADSSKAPEKSVRLSTSIDESQTKHCIKTTANTVEISEVSTQRQIKDEFDPAYEQHKSPETQKGIEEDIICICHLQLCKHSCT